MYSFFGAFLTKGLLQEANKSINNRKRIPELKLDVLKEKNAIFSGYVKQSNNQRYSKFTAQKIQR